MLDVLPDEASLAMVIAHELAHMWFGDNVTLRQWNDIVDALNETLDLAKRRGVERPRHRQRQPRHDEEKIRAAAAPPTHARIVA